MKTKLLRWRLHDIARPLLASFVAGHSFAATFSEWQERQPIEVPAPGLVKVALPPATLDALRPAMEDLRLADSTENEVPFLIERPAPEPAPVRAARSFKPVLRGVATVLEIETGTDVPINAVTLETPEREFINRQTRSAHVSKRESARGHHHLAALQSLLWHGQAPCPHR